MHATRSQAETRHWLRLLWTRDQSVIATCTSQHTTLTTGRHQCPRGIRTRKPNNTLPTVHALDRTANGTVQVTVCVQYINKYIA